jgi:hypothetical protein
MQTNKEGKYRKRSPSVSWVSIPTMVTGSSDIKNNSPATITVRLDVLSSLNIRIIMNNAISEIQIIASLNSRNGQTKLLSISLKKFIKNPTGPGLFV